MAIFFFSKIRDQSKAGCNSRRTIIKGHQPSTFFNVRVLVVGPYRTVFFALDNNCHTTVESIGRVPYVN